MGDVGQRRATGSGGWTKVGWISRYQRILKELTRTLLFVLLFFFFVMNGGPVQIYLSNGDCDGNGDDGVFNRE